MKTMKIFAAVLGLFLTISMNVVLAQETERNDSIYGLEVFSDENGYINLSFYSTYDLDNGPVIIRIFVSKEPAPGGTAISLFDILYQDHMFNNNFTKIDNISNDGSYRINVNSSTSYDFLAQNYYRMTMFIEKESKEFESNFLTFFFNPLSTSLNEIINKNDHTSKYFLLSGMEVKELLVGVPLIQKTYNGNKLVSTDKVFRNK